MVKSGSMTKKHKLNEFEQEGQPKKMRKNSFNVSDVQDKLSSNSKKKSKKINGQDLQLKNEKPVLISSYSPQSDIKKEKNLKRKAQDEEGQNESTVPKLSKKQRKMLNKNNNPGLIVSKTVDQSENSASKLKKNKTTIVTQGSTTENQSPAQSEVKLTKNQKKRLNRKLKLQAQKVGSSEGLPSPQKSPEKPVTTNLLTKNQARRIRRNKGKGGQFTNGSIKNAPLAKSTLKSSSKLIKPKEDGSESEDSDVENQEEESDNESEEEDNSEPESEVVPKLIKIDSSKNKKLTKQEEIEKSDEGESEDSDVEEEESDGESEEAEAENVFKSKPQVKPSGNESDEEDSDEEDSDEEDSDEEDSDEEISGKDLLDLEAEEGKETSEEESSDDENVVPKKLIQSNSEDQSENSEESSDEDKEDFSNANSTNKIVGKPTEQYPVNDTKVVLRDLPENVTEEMIRETFSFVGEIKSISIPFNRATNKPKQFAFMVLEDKDSAQKVIELSKIAKVGDQVVFIKEYIEYPDDQRGRGRSPGGFRGSPGRGGGFRGGNSEGGGFRGSRGGDRRSSGGFRGSGERRGGGFRGSRGGGSPGRGGGFRGSRGGDRGGFKGSPGRGGGFRGSRNNEGGGFRGSRGGDRRSSGGFRGKAGGGTYDN